MPTVIKKSLLRMVFLYFVLLGLLIFGAVYVLYYLEIELVPVEVLGAALGVMLVYVLLVYYFGLVRPLKSVMKEMKALLTGRPYRKIFTRRLDEVGVLAHFFNEVTKTFEKVTTDIQEGKRMLGELEIAGQLQKDILPEKSPDVPGLLVTVKTRPAVELGGDNFDFIQHGENTFLYVGDVTGHGVPAALVMTMANSLIHTFVDIYDNAYDVVVNTNKQLKTRIKSTMFMTMLMLRWDNMNQKMTYVGCGHEHLVIYRAATGKCESQKSGGIALGMVPDNSKLVKEQEIQLDVGDVVILYSDGLTEGRNMSGEMYTLERLISAVERFAAEYGPEGIVNHVAKDYSKFVQEHVQDDDVTLMAVQYTGQGEKKLKTSDLVDTKWDVDEKDVDKGEKVVPAVKEKGAVTKEVVEEKAVPSKEVEVVATKEGDEKKVEEKVENEPEKKSD